MNVLSLSDHPITRSRQNRPLQQPLHDYNACMASSLARTGTLTIRNLDWKVKDRLRVRAAENGRSMEAEVRAVLSESLAPQAVAEPNLAEAIRRRFASVESTVSTP